MVIRRVGGVERGRVRCTVKRIGVVDRCVGVKEVTIVIVAMMILI